MPLVFTTRFFVLETDYHKVATAARNTKRLTTIFPPDRYWYLCIIYIVVHGCMDGAWDYSLQKFKSLIRLP